MTKQRRWLKSVIVASHDTEVTLPFQRQNRRRPEAFHLSEVTEAAPLVKVAS
jgi:hypothetical protein